ncbi:MAG: hypothetical protein H6R01_1922 [Burkholderiaceae bacterium]|nr:hypothetical protein [Burkholderiaceae bacterium]
MRARLLQGHRTLKEEYGAPAKGTPTGPGDAFVIDAATRESMLNQDPQSAAVLKPYVAGRDIDKWQFGQPSRWLVHLPAGKMNVDDYPAVRQYLETHRAELEKRPGHQKWYELDGEYASESDTEVQPKIIFFQDAGRPAFALDRSGAHFAHSGFSLPHEDYYLLGVLNSKLQRFLIQSQVEESGVEAGVQQAHLEVLPFPVPLLEHKTMIGSTSHFCVKLAGERDGFHAHMHQEIAQHLAPGGAASELSERLLGWHLLDIVSFQEEVRRHFGAAIAQDMLPSWDGLLREAKQQLSIIDADMWRAEQQIDRCMYEMFELSEEEIELLNSRY